MTTNANQNAWTDEERRLREREVATQEVASNTQKTTVRIQVFAAFLTVVATAATAVAAYAAADAVKTSQNIAAQQAMANQLGMAFTALGNTFPPDQVAGLTLLLSNVEAELNIALSDRSERQEANGEYVAALGVFDTYLRTAPSESSDPISSEYAAKALSDILGMGSELKTIDEGLPPLGAPSIDLADVALPGVDWPGVRFDWLASAWMPNIDLEGADLAHSHWGNATLTNAILRCADLRGADLRQANLTGADLRGAELQGALLPPADKLAGVKTAGAIGPVQGLSISSPGSSYNPDGCFGTRLPGLRS
jgi:hypothetical protein